MVYGPSVPRRLAQYTIVDANGCHIWTSHRDNKGYGRIFADGKSRRTHRVAFEIKIGRHLNKAECVCHRCDVPACSNTDHLFLGTLSDNSMDGYRKGRIKPPTPVGKWALKLDADKALAIRIDGRTLRAIADAFGVSYSTVQQIKAGRIWKSLSDDATRRQLGGDLAGNVSETLKAGSSLHAQQHGGVDGQEVGCSTQGVGCDRAR
jgi:hypothetical protein